MNGFFSSLWAETLKARRSKVPLLASIGFTLAPLMGGLFMFIYIYIRPRSSSIPSNGVWLGSCTRYSRTVCSFT